MVQWANVNEEINHPEKKVDIAFRISKVYNGVYWSRSTIKALSYDNIHDNIKGKLAIYPSKILP